MPKDLGFHYPHWAMNLMRKMGTQVSQAGTGSPCNYKVVKIRKFIELGKPKVTAIAK